jgi:hypothetical protein
MLNLFRPRLPIDRDEYDWLLAVFAWLVQTVDRDRGYREARTILPTRDFFPPSSLEGHDRAVELFEQVRAHAGMTGWPCELVAGEAERETRIAVGHALKHEYSPPGGTFGHDGNSVVITYNPSALARPADLVATFAHELAHYLIHADGSLPPGGEALEEHATDVAAVFLGFGVFQANGAKNFAQFQTEAEAGWEMRRQGYLSEEALTAALAIFVRMAGEDADAAEAELKDYLRGGFRSTLKVLDRDYPDLRGTLETADLSGWQ